MTAFNRRQFGQLFDERLTERTAIADRTALVAFPQAGFPIGCNRQPPYPVALLLPNSFYGRRFNPDETAINAVEFFIRNLGGHVGMPAEDYFPGDCAAIQTERGLLLLTLTENDPEARVWHTAGDFKVYTEVPYEYLEGKVSAFCLPHVGFVADDWPVLLPIFAGGAALF